jgi:hypothetical protein
MSRPFDRILLEQIWSYLADPQTGISAGEDMVSYHLLDISG